MIGKKPSPEVLRQIESVVAEAKKGNVSVLPKLRAFLDEFPALWKTQGNLARQAEFAWIDLISGPNKLARERLARKAAELRAELAGPEPSPMVRLLAERTVATWLQVNYYNMLETQQPEMPDRLKLAAYRARRQEQAHRMYVSSLKALEDFKKMTITSKIVVEIEQKKKTHGEKSEAGSNSKKAKQESAPVNRISDLFDEDDSNVGEKQALKGKAFVS